MFLVQGVLILKMNLSSSLHIYVSVGLPIICEVFEKAAVDRALCVCEENTRNLISDSKSVIFGMT